jgi:hypothetical protein
MQMGKFKVLYRSEGILSGHEPGDEVEIPNSHDAARLQELGLVEKVKDAAKTTAPKTAPAKTTAAAKK